ncbi:MAG: hypothetical protein ACFFDP_01580 [Promethearchaeota archaeon]
MVECAVCGKELVEEEIQENLKYLTREDRVLSGETSHFKHIHVTHYFCSKECKEEFMDQRYGKVEIGLPLEEE